MGIKFVPKVLHSAIEKVEQVASTPNVEPTKNTNHAGQF